MKRLNKILLFIHQLPQNILGFIISKILKAELLYTNVDDKIIPYYYVKQGIFVSLGDYIIVYENAEDNDLKHEYGHHLQSLRLGWLYLLLIGIPSFIGAIVYTFKRFDYYSLLWEKWADKLGGVKR